MKIKELPGEFIQALPVLEKINGAGFEAYFVGGSVRDVLLGQPIHDVDIATSAYPEEIKQIFGRTVDLGIEHGTVLVLAEGSQYEITTFRTESTYQDFRRPDHVEFVRSLAEDLKRRDFTINAFALKSDGTVVDLFDGLEDLATKTLRAVGVPQERFHEDALRMMRGLRFVSQLGFAFEPATFEAILANHGLLGKISVERIYVEFSKLLMGQHRQEALRQLVETECYEYCPGLRTSGEGLLRMADLPNLAFASEAQGWALLADQIELAEGEIKPFLKKWKASNELIQQTRQIFMGLQWRKTQAFSDWQLYQLGAETAKLAEELLAFFGKSTNVAAVSQRYEQLPIHSLADLEVNGHDLIEATGKKPGQWLKLTLAYLEQRVVEAQLLNKKAVLLAQGKQFIESRGL